MSPRDRGRQTILKKIAVAALAAALASSTASAATVVHLYAFNGSTVTDSVGGVNGTLVNGATVSGGALHLDGVDDKADLSAKLIPSDGSAFSVYLQFVTVAPQDKYYTELLSQGASGGGFYLGSVGGNIRLTDNYAGGIAAPFPVGAHDILLTSGGGSGTKVYVDGASVFSSASDLTAVGASGDNTRFGSQFSTYNEYFRADLKHATFFSGVASYAEATASAVPEPGTWAMLIGGFGIIGAGMRRRSTRMAFA